MSLYKENDLDILRDNIDDILKKVNSIKMEKVEPYVSEIEAVNEIIMNYIKEKKRKVYGGFALNLLLKEKDKNDMIYEENEYPDIDFYSPEPLIDLVEICNILYENDFKFIRGTEAQHKETYSIRVNNHLYCDISYVPKQIYNSMPFIIIDGLHVISPKIYTIDFFRMMTDPLTSYWRIEKNFERFYKIQKHYPFAKINSPINLVIPKKYNNEIKILSNKIIDFLTNNNSTITVGFYAYNHYLLYSKILNSKTNKKKKKYRVLKVPYYEIISTNYVEDSLSLISQLKEINEDISNNITVVEHYPYFAFFDYSAHIYYKDALIAIIYDHNKKCIPYFEVKALNFNDEKMNKNIGADYIHIGTFSLVLLYGMINALKSRTDNNKTMIHINNTFISHLLEMRNYYFNLTGDNILSKSLFRDFVLECKGQTITAEKERALIIEERKKKNQRLMFAYDPSDGVIDNKINFIFANSSGNPINNPKNLKLTPYSSTIDELEDEQNNE